MEDVENTSKPEEMELSGKSYFQDVSLEEAENNIHACLRDAARNVIATGHYLKVIRDKELYREAGYENIWDYAAERFGFSKSTASRYMTRNDKFSVGGNSPILAEEFREYSKAQLQEMLSLDAEQMSAVTPDMTVREIRELRRPKEIPYFEIPGQLSLSDFPELDEAETEDSAVENSAPTETMTSTTAFTVSAEDLIGEPEEKLSAYGLPKRVYPANAVRKIEGCEGANGEGHNSAPTETMTSTTAFTVSAEDLIGEPEEKLSAYGLPKRVYPANAVRKIEGCEGANGEGHNCLECHLECELCEELCMCVEATGRLPLPCTMVRTETWEDLKEQVGSRCQFVTLELAKRKEGSDEPVPCCKECQTPCVFACTVSGKRVATSQQLTAADATQETTGTAAEKQQKEPQDSMTIRGFIKHWKETCPDDFNLTLRAMRAGKDAGEKAKSIQRALAPHGFHGISCSEYSFEFYSFSGGMDWMVDGQKIHLKYGRLANELLCMYDPNMSQFDAQPVPPINEPQSSELRSITEDPENQEDVAPEDCEEGDDASSAEITDLQLLRDMLDRKKRLLATNLAIPGIDVSDGHIRKQKLEVAALASMICDLENTIEPEEIVDEKPEQPELPRLRNNDQRAAFVDAYETWPLWIETKETGERYYRYDLPDGTSFVVKTYHSMLYDYKAGTGMRYKEGYGANEQYILEPGKFFRDCSANRSAMIEKLKELQKAGS